MITPSHQLGEAAADVRAKYKALIEAQMAMAKILTKTKRKPIVEVKQEDKSNG